MDLDGLLDAVPPPDDVRSDAHEVVSELRTRLADAPPACLAQVTGEWRDPYLLLWLHHQDGRVVEVRHGDGFTAITGAELDYKHYLDTGDLIGVLGAAVRGELVYARRGTFGLRPSEHFLVGSSRAQVGLDRVHPGRLLSFGRPQLFRISFASTPAVVRE